MTDFGSDFAALDDLDPLLSFHSGEEASVRALTEACYRSLITPRGGMFYDPNYGTDIRQFLVDTMNPRIVEQAISTELLKDERIAHCEVRVTIDPDTSAWKVEIKPTAADGTTFALVFLASADKVSLLTEI